jgi:signal transduction histidine kinase
VGESATATVIRLAGLVLLSWATFSEERPGFAGAHLAVWVLLVAAASSWILWSFGVGRRSWLRAALLVSMGAVGGALAALAPVALTFVGAAAFLASFQFELPVALGLAAAGPAVVLLAALIRDRPGSLVVGGAAAALAGLVLGVSRRQMIERVEQAALVAVERERAELEHARSEVLAERNRLAREIHDVLAHTLGALSVQLEALTTIYDAGPEKSTEMREGLKRTKSLAGEGLEEARRAVSALREDSAPLVEQLAALCRRCEADLVVSGEVRPLGSEAVVALFRAAQESITNATKHAPGATVSVRLAFEAGSVTLEVLNGAGSEPPGALADSGGGYGLQGISERIKLLDGTIDAGPLQQGWRVSARLPA